MGTPRQVILGSSPVLTYSFTGIKPHIFIKVTQNLQVKQGGEFSQAWCFLLEDRCPLPLKKQPQKLIPDFLLVTKLFSAPRRKSCEMLEGWFLPTHVDRALANGTGKVKDGPHSSFVSFSSSSAL